MHFKLSITFTRSKKTEPEHEEDFDDSLSTASTIAPSKSHSFISSFLAAFSTEKFMNDPMRTSNHPDVVGYYYDPMSCGRPHNGHYVYATGTDCTNTGA
ncbi:hypothetical protein INT47_001736 [Mucor saturninus]|uniref:Uncharacterized protein n=1 Tax=Mucor saturninus TaxID=64648 RepID=A0A8H7V9N7_9FUNG|nr:hypothetical protein INT47_001736 [Mucor saturninus]